MATSSTVVQPEREVVQEESSVPGGVVQEERVQGVSTAECPLTGGPATRADDSDSTPPSLNILRPAALSQDTYWVQEDGLGQSESKSVGLLLITPSLWQRAWLNV